jgi:hypothetical protein
MDLDTLRTRVTTAARLLGYALLYASGVGTGWYLHAALR